MTFPLPRPMRRAIELAREAAEHGEVPVGAVMTRGEEEVVAEARNAMRSTFDPTAHAEIMAIRATAERLQTSRLDDCMLWVSLEPCAMCAAAISIARLKALRFAAEDPKGGAVANGSRWFGQATCHHRPDVLGGIGEEESAELLRAFFAARR